MMLPGVSGSLVTPTFLDRVLVQEFGAGQDWNPTLGGVRRWWHRVERTIGPATSARLIADTAAIPFFEARGYRPMQLEPQGSGFSGILMAPNGTRVAIRVAPWGHDPEREWRDTVRAGRLGGARWGVVFTGAALRIIDATRTWSRRALEFDLATALGDERSALALVALVEAAGAPPGADLATLVMRSERHGVEVCASLGIGVVEALSALYEHLCRASRRRAGDHAAFEQSITLVYRLLFLLFAEARAIVPIWHHTYRNAYTIEALCTRALAQPERRGLWKALQAISRLAHRGCRAGDLVVAPFNGRLFSPHHTPLAERAQVSDAAVGRAVVSLATSAARDARERIAYADLGVEQLGAVYERVLEYEPARDGARRGLTRTSHDRKSSGSFYTPRSLTDFLVRRALHPLVDGKSADQILALRILDPAMGSGAFLVAACRYLSAAVERALADEGGPSTARNRHARSAVRRLVAQRCLFGVDLNPMAVQLARLSLWLATLAVDRPLTFLDHHLAVGDSLAGAWLSHLRREPFATRRRSQVDSPLPLFEHDAARVLSHAVLPARFRLALTADDTASTVHDKERTLAALTAAGTPLARCKAAANLWCAAWFRDDRDELATEQRSALTAGVYHDVLATLSGHGGTLNPRHCEGVLAHAQTIATARRFFHWELEFPEVFFTPTGERRSDGGFDAVLGNPPWEMLRADAGDRAERDRIRQNHRAALRFFRDARVYQYQSRGHINRYQLFLERALQLAKPGGRIALIVPAGLAADHGSAGLRRALLDQTAIERIFGFDNHQAIFPIHRDVRFLLLIANKGRTTDRLVGALGRSEVQWLDRLPDAAADDPADARGLTITRTLLEQWDPEHLTVPWLASAKDLDILANVSAVTPPLSARHGWQVTFGRELNATEDRVHFVSRLPHHGRSMLPVIEGKHIEPFRVDVARSMWAIDAGRAATLIDAARTFGRARLAYRDVASATNRLTLIVARLGAGTISTHTVFCSREQLDEDAQYCLLSLLNSLVANYLVRLRVMTHVTTAVMARLPVPRPPSTSPEFRELSALGRQLEKSGVAGHEGAWQRVNLLTAGLYGLSQTQYEHILSTFKVQTPGLAP